MPQPNPYMQQPAPTGQPEKRQRKPLMIRDPISNQPVEVPSLSTSSTPATTISTVSATTTITETRPTETTTDSTTTTDTNKTQIQTDYRQRFANLFTDTPTDKVYFRYSKQQDIY